MSLKTKRISSAMVREISAILNEEVRDELLKNVSITDVTVDDDLTFAKVYFITRLDDSINMEKELNEASKFIRMHLAHRLNLRSTPELKFVYDKSLDYSEKIDKIIEEIHEDESHE